MKIKFSEYSAGLVGLMLGNFIVALFTGDFSEAWEHSWMQAVAVFWCVLVINYGRRP